MALYTLVCLDHFGDHIFRSFPLPPFSLQKNLSRGSSRGVCAHTCMRVSLDMC